MNSHRILAVATGIVLASGLGTGIAYAQPQDPSCADAIAARVQLQGELDAAIRADKAAADAKAADDAVVATQETLESAQQRALGAGVPIADQNQASVNRLRTELNELEDIPTEERSVEEQRRIGEIRERLPLIEAVVSAQADLTRANNVAGRTDAAVLQREADKTNADTLKFQLEAAIAVANEACDNDPNPTPTPTPPPAVPVDNLDCDDFATQALAQVEFDKDRNDPHNLDADNDNKACEVHFGLDDDDNAPVPSGGVDTGDGSSL